jgi:hypothetical protein
VCGYNVDPGRGDDGRCLCVVDAGKALASARPHGAGCCSDAAGLFVKVNDGDPPWAGFPVDPQDLLRAVRGILTALVRGARPGGKTPRRLEASPPSTTPRPQTLRGTVFGRGSKSSRPPTSRSPTTTSPRRRDRGRSCPAGGAHAGRRRFVSDRSCRRTGHPPGQSALLDRRRLRRPRSPSPSP